MADDRSLEHYMEVADLKRIIYQRGQELAKSAQRIHRQRLALAEMRQERALNLKVIDTYQRDMDKGRHYIESAKLQIAALVKNAEKLRAEVHGLQLHNGFLEAMYEHSLNPDAPPKV